MDRKNILRDYEFTREDYVFVEAVMSQHARDLAAKAEEKKQELLRYKKSMSEDMSRAIESIFDPVPMYEPITEEDEKDYARRQREYEAQCEENIQRLLKETEYAGSLSVKARMLHSFGDERANN